jgi:hypothetical protein
LRPRLGLCVGLACRALLRCQIPLQVKAQPFPRSQSHLCSLFFRLYNLHLASCSLVDLADCWTCHLGCGDRNRRSASRIGGARSRRHVVLSSVSRLLHYPAPQTVGANTQSGVSLVNKRSLPEPPRSSGTRSFAAAQILDLVSCLGSLRADMFREQQPDTACVGDYLGTISTTMWPHFFPTLRTRGSWDSSSVWTLEQSADRVQLTRSVCWNKGGCNGPSSPLSKALARSGITVLKAPVRNPTCATTANVVPPAGQTGRTWELPV